MKNWFKGAGKFSVWDSPSLNAKNVLIKPTVSDLSLLMSREIYSSVLSPHQNFICANRVSLRCLLTWQGYTRLTYADKMMYYKNLAKCGERRASKS